MRYERYYLAVQRFLVLLLLGAAMLLLCLRTGDWPGSGAGEPQAALSAQAALAPALPAAKAGFANLTVAVDGDWQLALAYLLVNGERAGDFRTGALTVRVYPGDVVSVDGSAYGRSIGFTLTDCSASLDPDYLRSSVVCSGDTARLGVIVFR